MWSVGVAGIGSHIAQELAGNGINLCITYNANAERAETVAAQARELGVNASIVQMTLQNAEQIQSVVNGQIGATGSPAYRLYRHRATIYPR